MMLRAMNLGSTRKLDKLELYKFNSTKNMIAFISQKFF